MKMSSISNKNNVKIMEISEPAARRRINRLQCQIERMNYIFVSLLIFTVVILSISMLAFYRKQVSDIRISKALSEKQNIINGLNESIEDKDKIIAQKESEISLYQDDVVTVVNEYNKLYNDFTATTDMNIELAKQNEEFANTINSDNSELDDLRHRAELYDKYNYAIINQMDENIPDDERRTDITYDQIDTLETLAAENGLSNDAVAFVLAIAMNESRGKEDSKNPNSTATGYCGILDFTGKYLYEDIMGNPEGSYSHDMCYNGYINLELALQYVKYLNDMYGGDIQKIENSYRGYYDAAYDSQLDQNLQRAGKSLYTLHLSADE